MKKIIFIMFLMLSMSCMQRTYITVVDVNDGKFITVRDQQHYTNVGDTLVISYDSKEYRGHFIYGKFKNEMPKQLGHTVYLKVVRTK